MDAARTRGLAVGRDVAIIGFDDEPMSRVLWPPLTSIRQPLREVGRACIEILTRLIKRRTGRASPRPAGARAGRARIRLNHQPPGGRHPMPDLWTISRATFDTASLHHHETIFTIGNGYLATRGAFEEGYPGDRRAHLRPRRVRRCSDGGDGARQHAGLAAPRRVPQRRTVLARARRTRGFRTGARPAERGPDASRPLAISCRRCLPRWSSNDSPPSPSRTRSCSGSA